MISLRSLRVVFSCFALAAFGHSETLIHTWRGSWDGFGWSVAGVGDLDGDGFDDVAISERTVNAFSFANVQTFSGRDGLPLLAISGRDGKLIYAVRRKPTEYNGSNSGEAIVSYALVLAPLENVRGHAATDESERDAAPTSPRARAVSAGHPRSVARSELGGAP